MNTNLTHNFALGVVYRRPSVNIKKVFVGFNDAFVRKD